MLRNTAKIAPRLLAAWLLALLSACAGLQNGDAKNAQGEAVFAAAGQNAAPLYASGQEDASEQPLLQKALSLFTAASARAASPDVQAQLQALAGSATAYRMGAGDVIDIDISGMWQRPDFRAQIALNADGVADLGDLGAYRLQGLSRAQAQRVLRTALDNANASPKVALRIDQYRSQSVRLQGEVYTPGDYFIDDQPMSLAEAITRAGGLLEQADLAHIQLQRAGQVQSLNLRQLYDLGLPPENLLLRTGDVLTFLSKP
jgi:polysaccharide export outer membrane protein